MASVAESNKPKNRKDRRPNSSDSLVAPSTKIGRDFTIQQDNKPTEEKEEEKDEEKRTRMKRNRPTKVGLNNTLRRIRHLIVEGRSNLEIQSILQLNERTFYRYMAKIHEIDHALFLEQEKESMASEISVFRDRLLKTYRWFVAMADNKEINPSTRMEAQRNAIEVAWALIILKFEGPSIIQKSGLLENLYRKSSYQRSKRGEARKSIKATTASSSPFRYNEEEGEGEGEEKEDHSMNQQHMQE
jgi:DNA-binding CsgD family transcriptional regulator